MGRTKAVRSRFAYLLSLSLDYHKIDYSIVYFSWLAAMLKVITSGIMQPCKLQQPLPIAHLWLFNISVHEPMKYLG